MPKEPSENSGALSPILNLFSKQVSLKALFYLWASTLLLAIPLLGDGNFIGFLPTMVVHELGHCIFSFLTGIPAVSFFMVTFSFSNEPLPLFVLLLIVFESFLLWYAYRKKLVLTAVLTATAFLLHLYFLLTPKDAMHFFIFGGVAGEFVLPLVLLVLLAENVQLRRKWGLILFAVGSFAFWRALINWTLTFLGHRAIPYPRDGGGSFGLFQNPFDIADGAPTGDIDKLIKIYSWTEPEIIRIYVVIGFLCFAGFCSVWTWFFLRDLQSEKITE